MKSLTTEAHYANRSGTTCRQNSRIQSSIETSFSRFRTLKRLAWSRIKQATFLLNRVYTTRWLLKTPKTFQRPLYELRSLLQNNPSSPYRSQGLPIEALKVLPELSTKTKPCSQSRGRQHLGLFRSLHATWGVKKPKRRLSRTLQLNQLVARHNLSTIQCTRGYTTTKITRTHWRTLRRKCR